MNQDQNKTPEEIIAEYKQQQKSKKGKKRKIIIGVVVGWIVLSSLVNVFSGESGSTDATFTSSASTTVEDTSWIPAGFNSYLGDSNLAWRWGSKSETNCTYSDGSCWSIVAIAKNGCPRSLYGEINIFDSNDVQISYTNDTLGTVAPMQKVKLTFDTFEESASSANISRFSCY